MIDRLLHNECLDILRQFPVLGIVGPRQCGKTTLAKQLISSMDTEVIYLDLEDTMDLAKLTEPELFLSQHQDKLIILDEIQIKPEIFNLLRALIDQNRRPSRFIILGSASPDLMRNSANSLAGRIAYVELTPLSCLELGGKITLNKHWFRGGYPDAVLTKSDVGSTRWQKNFIQTYVQRDLGLLGLHISPNMANRLLSIVSHLHGNLVNFSNIARSLGVSSPTGRGYVDFLVNSFILRQLQPFHTNTRKRLVKQPKLFYRDSGMLHYLHRINNSEQLFGHPIAGNSWEGYVIEEIARKYHQGFDFYFYRTARGAECDLVLTRNLIPQIAIEIKLTNSPKPSRGLIQSIKDLKTTQNYIITLGSERFPLASNIEAISFEEFLNLDFLN